MYIVYYNTISCIIMHYICNICNTIMYYVWCISFTTELRQIIFFSLKNNLEKSSATYRLYLSLISCGFSSPVNLVVWILSSVCSFLTALFLTAVCVGIIRLTRTSYMGVFNQFFGLHLIFIQLLDIKFHQNNVSTNTIFLQYMFWIMLSLVAKFLKMYLSYWCFHLSAK